MKYHSNQLKNAACLVCSFTFLYFALKNISWRELVVLATQTPPLLLVWVIVINLFARFFSTFRWWVLLSDAHKTSFSDAFHYLNIGYFINSVFPARAGDFIKAILLAKKYSYGKTSALASITIERLFDMVGLGMVFIASLLVLTLPIYLKQGGFVVLVIGVGVLFLLVSLADRSKNIYNFLAQFSSRRIYLWIVRRIELVLSYCSALRNSRVFIGAFVSTAVIWFFYVLAGYVVVLQISPGPLSWHVALLSLLIISVSFVLPTTPGNLGIYQFACVLAFSIADMPKEPAMLFSLISQLPVYLQNVFLGLYSMGHEGLQRNNLQLNSFEQNDLSDE